MSASKSIRPLEFKIYSGDVSFMATALYWKFYVCKDYSGQWLYAVSLPSKTEYEWIKANSKEHAVRTCNRIWRRALQPFLK